MSFEALFLALLFTMASSKVPNLLHDKPGMPFTKYVKGVPIHNYQNALNLKKDSGRQVQNCTKWLVVAQEERMEEMRSVCAHSPLGKKHCSMYVPQSIPAFIFEGNEDELNMLLDFHNPLIEFVEPDFELKAIEEVQSQRVRQVHPHWGLDRIAERQRMSGWYEPGLDGGYGAGVHVYVLDTGIMTAHQEFGGRAIPTFDATSGRVVLCNAHDASCALDLHGHGTHCAGIIGVLTYGVAKGVTLHAGKVLGDTGAGTFSMILSAFDWLVDNKQEPAVASLSLGGFGISDSVRMSIDAVVDAGITVVVAAGNDHSDACFYQPAFVASAITVGATSEPLSLRSGDIVDPIAFYSNIGLCVDIFAPGTDITSCGIIDESASATMSGTSMACPAVAGASALVINAYPDASPAQVKELLKSHATKGTLCEQYQYPKYGSPEDLLYVGPTWVVAPEQDSQSLAGLHSESTLQYVLLFSITIFIVVGIFAGVKWHKAAFAGVVMSEPLLG